MNSVRFFLLFQYRVDEVFNVVTKSFKYNLLLYYNLQSTFSIFVDIEQFVLSTVVLNCTLHKKTNEVKLMKTK